jgi:arylsulfatase A
VSSTDRTRPNVVVVICDDIGYGDLACNGGTVLNTPELDRLAADGVRATAMYSGGPTCSPSRAALLTGRVAPRNGVARVTFPDEDRGLHHDEKTIATYLSAAGYATGCFGKWHVGQMPERGPVQFGFDTYFGLPFSNDTPPYLIYRDSEVAEEDPDMGPLTQRYVEEAIRFVDSVDDGRPFFTYVAFTAPHYPIEPDRQFAGRSAGGPYGDTVETIDHYVGFYRAELQRRGMLDNTIFVFTADHGPWFEGSTGGVRGRKFETWDGGTRVPFLISWPGRLPEAVVVEPPIASVDILPTLCFYLGIEPAASHPFDGEVIAATLEGEQQDEHGPIWFFDEYQVNAVRRGRWKLHRRRQTWGAERFAEMSLPQLFDMEQDPGESYDLSSRHPEIVAELSLLMESMADSLDTSADDGRRWWVDGEVVAR